MPILRGVLVFPAQLVGGIAAAGVVSALFPGPLNCATRLGGDTSIVQGLFIEVFLTAQLVFVVIMLAVVKHKATYLAPIGIGLAFFFVRDDWYLTMLIEQLDQSSLAYHMFQVTISLGAL